MSIGTTNLSGKSHHFIACRIINCIEPAIEKAIEEKLNETVEEVTWREYHGSGWESHAELNTPEWLIVDVEQRGIETIETELRVKAGEHHEFQLILASAAKKFEGWLLMYEVKR